MRARYIYRSSVYVLSALAVVNLAVAYMVYRRASSPLQYNVNVIEHNVNPVAYTNEVPVHRPGLLSSSSPISPQQAIPPPAPVPQSWRYSYQYFVANGRRMALLNGVYIREGDLHAYGVVREIFPERIYFEGGAYIDNQKGAPYDAIGTAADPLPK